MTKERDSLFVPTLHDVRYKEVGKFFKKEIDFNKFGSANAEQIKSTKWVTHPRWFDQQDTTKQMTLYIGKNAHDLLMKEKSIRRWKKNKHCIWNPKEKQWYHFRRTPGKIKGEMFPSTDFVEGKVDRRPPGRSPMGKAYRFRRESWLTLAAEHKVIRMLKTQELTNFERGKRVAVSLRLPDLSEAITELLKKEVLPSIEDDVDKLGWIVNEWLKFRDISDILVSDASEILYSEPSELDRFIETLSAKHWKGLMARWIELHIFFSYGKNDEGEKIKLARID